MSQTIPINMPDGTVQDIDADTIVNAQNALVESMRRPPMFHKIHLVPCRVDVEREVAQIQGGIGFIKHPARMRMAAAAGCRQYGAPRVWRELVGDQWVTRAQISFSRPGFYDQPVSIIAEGVEADQPKNIRQHFTAKLQTQATKRCLTQILGEAFSYDIDYLRSRKGLFVFACVVEDADDPDVRQVMLQRMRGASHQLYGTPMPEQPMAQPEAVETFQLTAGEDHEFEGEAEAGIEPPNQGESAIEGPASATRPSWVSSYVIDRPSGAVNWESIPIEQTEQKVRAEIKAAAYPLEGDNYGVVAACKRGDWIDAAQRLYNWQQAQEGVE